ncbi:MAG: hypothetical protein ACRDT0_05055 [Pseudonocardiaceae bacterium]
MKAGAAPLVRIIPITAQTPIRNRPGRFALATVPFLTVSVVRWSKVTVGDTVGRLVHLLQERGGIWLAKHTTATLTWTVSPTAESSDPLTAEDGTTSPRIPWVRIDATFAGAWTGRFALAAPAPPLAASLWCVATSPLVGILADEVADKALLPIGDTRPVAWQPFTEALDNSVHATTRPSDVVRDLVMQSAWPGSDLLKKRGR